MSPAGFGPAIPSSEWPQTYALYRAVTGICGVYVQFHLFLEFTLDGGEVAFTSRRFTLREVPRIPNG